MSSDLEEEEGDRPAPRPQPPALDDEYGCAAIRAEHYPLLDFISLYRALSGRNGVVVRRTPWPDVLGSGLARNLGAALRDLKKRKVPPAAFLRAQFYRAKRGQPVRDVSFSSAYSGVTLAGWRRYDAYDDAGFPPVLADPMADPEWAGVSVAIQAGARVLRVLSRAEPDAPQAELLRRLFDPRKILTCRPEFFAAFPAFVNGLAIERGAHVDDVRAVAWQMVEDRHYRGHVLLERQRAGF